MINGLQQKTITLGSMNNVRSYIYVEDVADGYITLSNVNPKKYFSFNIGHEIQHTTKEVIEITETLFDYQLKIEWNEATPRPWEFKNWLVDTTQMKNILKWQPRYSLKDGLQLSRNWFAEHLHLYK